MCWIKLEMILTVFTGHTHKKQQLNQISYRALALVVEIILHSVFMGKYLKSAHIDLKDVERL